MGSLALSTSAGEEDPQHLAIKWVFSPLGEIKDCWKPRHLLKGLHTDSLPGTLPGLQERDSGSGGTRNIQGKTELFGFTARAGRTATVVPVLSPPPTQPTSRYHLSYVGPSLYTAKFESALVS